MAQTRSLPTIVVRDVRPVIGRLPGSDLTIEDGTIHFDRKPLRTDLAWKAMYVLPGFADCHAHLSVEPDSPKPFLESVKLSETALRDRALRHLVANLIHGVLLVRDLGAPRGTIAELSTSLEDEMPELFAAGRFLAPPGGFHPGLANEVSVAELVSVARHEAERGGLWVKFVGDFPRADRPEADPRLAWTANELAPAVRVAHSLGARVAIHATTEDSVSAAIAAGADSIEHGCALTEHQLADMANRGVAWTPTLAAFSLLLDEVRAGRARFPAHWLDQSVSNVRSLLRSAPTLPRILCGSDGALHHGEAAREALSFVDAGLPAESALRALTTDAWDYFGYEDPLSEGAPSNLVLFDRDPKEDLAMLLRPTAVIRAGRLVRA